MNYAYVSKSQDLHVVKDRATAEEYAFNGKVVETELPCAGGYLQYVKAEGKNGNEDKLDDIFVYFDTKEVFINGNKSNGRPVFLKDINEAAQKLVLALGYEGN